MSEAIEIEFGTPEVKIDYSLLAQELLSECSDGIADIANESIDHYMRYEFDCSDMVSDYVNDTIGDNIDSLLSDVTPGSLCGVGVSFANAVQVVMAHHIDMEQVLLNNESIEKGGMMDTLVRKALNKQMVVNVSFVDKQPAEIVETDTTTIPGPRDEINTRKDFHEGRENV